MPTIIDSLIVTLGIDSKGVDSKASGVQSKLSGIEKSAQATEKGVVGLTGALEAFGSVLGGIVSVSILTAFAKDIIDTNTHLYYLSQNLGVSAQKMYAWGQMAKQLGGSPASIQNFFGQIRGMYGQLLTGQTPALLPLFARLGINYNQSPEAITEALAEKFKDADSGPNRWKAASFLQASGLSEDVVNMVLQGPDWVKKHEKELTPLSPTDRQIQASALMTQKIVLVQTEINKLGNNLLSSIMPALNKAADSVFAILNWLLDHDPKKVLSDTGNAVKRWFTPEGRAQDASDQDKELQRIAGMSDLKLGGGLHQQVSAQQVEQYFAAKGYAPGWAAGIAANLMGESGGATNAQGDNGLAYGLAQWHPEWQALFRKRNGISMSQSTWQQQLDFIDSELRGQRKIDVGIDPGAAWAASYFARTYENPKDLAGAIKSRSAAAQELLNGIPSATSVSSSVSHTSNSNTVHSDSSKNVHIGTMNVNQPASQSNSSPGMSKGMDWLFTPQFNGALW